MSFLFSSSKEAFLIYLQEIKHNYVTLYIYIFKSKSIYMCLPVTSCERKEENYNHFQNTFLPLHSFVLEHSQHQYLSIKKIKMKHLPSSNLLL